MEKMLAGLSSRRYTAGLEPAGQAVESAAGSTSKSTVSRRFVAATETALAELITHRLDDLDLVAFMVDGVHFGEPHPRGGAGHRHRRGQAPADRGGAPWDH
jgi:putative transposase